MLHALKQVERRITLSEVRNAIRARNRDVSGGDLDSGKRRYLLRTIGRFETTAEMENMVVARRDGAFVRPPPSIAVFHDSQFLIEFLIEFDALPRCL